MLKSIVTAIVLATAATGASSATLTLDGAGKLFDNQVGAVKSDPTRAAWDRSFTFDIGAGQTAYLSVVDFWSAGDIYGVEINGVLAGLTSTPSGVAGRLLKNTFASTRGAIASTRDAINAALADDRFSSGQIALTEGSYTVTGFVSNYDAAKNRAAGFAMLTSSATAASIFAAPPQQTSAVQARLAPVPLPAAGWMLLAALSGLVFARRKS